MHTNLMHMEGSIIDNEVLYPGQSKNSSDVQLFLLDLSCEKISNM